MAAKRNGNKKQARRSGGGGKPGWVWALGGIAVGLTIAAVLYFRSGGSVEDLLPRPNPQARAPAEPEAPVAQDAPEPQPRKPKYDFYDVLRENEVVFPDAELNAQAAAEAAQAAEVAAVPPGNEPAPAEPVPAVAEAVDSVRYLIQAGAFRNATDAEALKARIAMTGEIARVESAEVNGATIYRVRLGPYPNASTLATAKQALGSHGIEAVAIRAK
jgi:cell division protein FtsN